MTPGNATTASRRMARPFAAAGCSAQFIEPVSASDESDGS